MRAWIALLRTCTDVVHVLPRFDSRLLVVCQWEKGGRVSPPMSIAGVGFFLEMSGLACEMNVYW